MGIRCLRQPCERYKQNPAGNTPSIHASILNVNFLLSTIALLLGPLVYAIGNRNAAARRVLDGIVFLAIAWIIGVHIIPESLSTGGWPAAAVLVLGIAFPILLKRVFHVATRTAHIAVMLVAASGLCLHALIDGIALLPAGDDRLALAVIVHRVPVGMALWWTFRPALGTVSAIGAFALIVIATGVAFYLGAPIVEMAESRWLAIFQAFVSGTLIELVAVGIRDRFSPSFRSAQ